MPDASEHVKAEVKPNDRTDAADDVKAEVVPTDGTDAADSQELNEKQFGPDAAFNEEKVVKVLAVLDILANPFSDQKEKRKYMDKLRDELEADYGVYYAKRQKTKQEETTSVVKSE